jgi:hypothetical protein
MDAATEAISFAAAAWSLELIDHYPGTDADRDDMIRNLAAYGPAITERD